MVSVPELPLVGSDVDDSQLEDTLEEGVRAAILEYFTLHALIST